MKNLVCNKCHQSKPDGDFHRDRSRLHRRGRHHTCRKCAAKIKAEKRKDPEYLARERARSKAWREKNPERSRRGIRCATLRKKYGISQDEFETMLGKQGGGCAICGSTSHDISVPGKRLENLFVDHCHETGEVRGLLCHSCNVSLGKMGDSPERLRNAADYLENGNPYLTPRH